jgi:hypothetical protein
MEEKIQQQSYNNNSNNNFNFYKGSRRSFTQFGITFPKQQTCSNLPPPPFFLSMCLFMLLFIVSNKFSYGGAMGDYNIPTL